MVMVEIDKSFIKLNHEKDYYLFIEDLKKALDEYEKPFVLNSFNLSNSSDQKMAPLDQYLSDLIKASENMNQILNEEGKTFIANYLKG